jgi:hypothetical protein
MTRGALVVNQTNPPAHKSFNNQSRRTSFPFIFEQFAYELLADIEMELPAPDANVIVLFVFNKLSYELPLVTTSTAMPSR